VFEQFVPLEAGRQPSPAAAEPSVELLVTDCGGWDGYGPESFGSSMPGRPPLWRLAEARLLAHRVHELIEGGSFSPGDVAVLFRAGTDMAVYELALDDLGLPTYVVGGRGYWSQQQVDDLLAYLAALLNPKDQLALYQVLASPLVGASSDSLALVAQTARRLGRDPWWALEQAFGDGGDGSDRLTDRLGGEDGERIASFCERFSAERSAAPRLALETVIDRGVRRFGYDLAVLAMPGGERRMANVRKLMRLAREYEANEGRDLRGFVDYAGQDIVQAREAEAPIEGVEDERLDAVRIMTIHAAKGLEFPVVCVADLGRRGRHGNGDGDALRIGADGRVGLELHSLGGDKAATTDYEAIKEDELQREDGEERRIFYVAMTRARRPASVAVSTSSRTTSWRSSLASTSAKARRVAR
jgi:ATP-dependent exoDNAse (exonuclease V) beta subunit